MRLDETFVDIPVRRPKYLRFFVGAVREPPLHPLVNTAMSWLYRTHRMQGVGFPSGRIGPDVVLDMVQFGVVADDAFPIVALP